MSEAVAAFFTAASWVLRASSCFFAAVWAAVMPALALSNWALGGTVPVCPEGVTSNCCGPLPLHVYSHEL